MFSKYYKELKGWKDKKPPSPVRMINDNLYLKPQDEDSVRLHGRDMFGNHIDLVLANLDILELMAAGCKKVSPKTEEHGWWLHVRRDKLFINFKDATAYVINEKGSLEAYLDIIDLEDVNIHVEEKHVYKYKNSEVVLDNGYLKIGQYRILELVTGTRTNELGSVLLPLKTTNGIIDYA